MTTTGRTVRILVGSAGRRPYLLQWFRDSLQRWGCRAEIAITEADPRAVTAAYADAVHRVPAYADPGYVDAMVDVFDRVRPDLFLSVNDHELTCLAGPVADKLRGYGGVVLCLDADRQQVVADKYAMATAFGMHGISCPTTVLGSDGDGLAALAQSAERLVIKDRYGSGSSGFAVVAAADVGAAVALHGGPHGRSDPDLMVVQPFLRGAEYGLDIVSDLTDSAEVTGLLARRKETVSQGVTTRVVTVDPAGMRPLAESIAHVVRPQGPVDVDLVETDEFGLQVLDVNPRFGGGYPFSHCAGSDVPGYLIAQLLAVPAPAGWNTCRVGATIGRYDSFVPID